MDNLHGLIHIEHIENMVTNGIYNIKVFHKDNQKIQLI